MNIDASTITIIILSIIVILMLIFLVISQIKTINKNIPLCIYQTWHNKILPTKMQECVNNLKRVNNEFNYFLYDDDECRNFIKDNFDSNVLNAYDKLLPGAYKADLWRYCILYLNGGVYLDIKFEPVDNFKLINLYYKNQYVRDRPRESKNGIYNAFIISEPKTKILLDSINKVVDNVNNNYYGVNPLDVTGPTMLSRIIDKDHYEQLELYNAKNGYQIIYKYYPILQQYKEYRQEQKLFQNTKYYSDMWMDKNIYDDSDNY